MRGGHLHRERALDLVLGAHGLHGREHGADPPAGLGGVGAQHPREPAELIEREGLRPCADGIAETVHPAVAVGVWVRDREGTPIVPHADGDGLASRSDAGTGLGDLLRFLRARWRRRCIFRCGDALRHGAVLPTGG